ncbi:MAG: hypothetical protein ACKVQR_04345 [Aquabacterium sp.]
MQTGPVDFEVFMSALAGAGLISVASFSWLSRRLDRMDAKLAASDTRNTLRHDNGLGDIWKALEAHRKETREATADATKTASVFREHTLRDLGDIKAALARLSPTPPKPED